MRTLGHVVLSLVPLVGFLVALGLSRKMLTPFDPPPKPSDWGIHPDDRQWEKEAFSESHQVLGGVASTAKSWGESIAVLLGLFGVVAFIKGPETVADLDPLPGFVTVSLILAGIFLAALAVTLAALAAQGSPKVTRQLDGWSLKQWHKSRVRIAIKLIAWSRILACSAVLAVLAAMSVSWLASIEESDPSPSVSILLIDENGQIHCVNTESTPPALSRIVEAVPVDACP